MAESILPGLSTAMVKRGRGAPRMDAALQLLLGLFMMADLQSFLVERSP